MDAILTPDPSVSLYDLLVQDHDFSTFLDSLARASAEHLSQHRPVLCGVTLTRARRNVVVASSSEQVALMDEIQINVGDGPCLHAQRTHTLVHVPDTDSEHRWPDYLAAVRSNRLRSILAVPLELEGPTTAAANFYCTEPHAFSERDIETALLYTRMASQVVGIALRIAASQEDAEHRRRAMESRTSINVAVGVIMGQNRCTQEEAFAILQQASSNRNMKLRVLAEELIGGIGQPAPITAFDASAGAAG
ncbi:GAF and ANTAR domain-containing protein [Nesterenkonia flava]|uniref:GAF and ANTAR domain-containing protein n=1 Tax=Nesterenkonia flava TaxID=469799 RepID=A0ABU1FTJ2_9MICC|nr:GAF and ANTAR domain-containing protein [Nesterenkonia flava]MDR5711498.1 GAF and ANTAR domain-containing protein [Nesterenkonia flava]